MSDQRRRSRSSSPEPSPKRQRRTRNTRSEERVLSSPEQHPRRVSGFDHLIASTDRLLGSRYTSSIFAPERPPLLSGSTSFESNWSGSNQLTSELTTPSLHSRSPSENPWGLGPSEPRRSFASEELPAAVPVDPTVVIDHKAYPHILQQVLEDASWDVLSAFRATCKEYRRKVHEIQSRQIIFFLAVSPPNAIRSPRGCVPSLRILHDNGHDHDPATSNLFTSTRVVDIIGCPREHPYSSRALQLAFHQRDLVLRFHPTSYRHDVQQSVRARRVVLFGSSIKSSWASLPPEEHAQEKTVLNLKGLNHPIDMITAFKRFPPSAGKRESTVVFTYWGVDKGYTVPVTLDDIVDPTRLARERLQALVDLAAGMVVGGWLFPEMPPVSFIVVDFEKITPRHFSLEEDGSFWDSGKGRENTQAVSPAGSDSDSSSQSGLSTPISSSPLSDALHAKICRRVGEMVDRTSSKSATVDEREARKEEALRKLKLMSRNEYEEHVGNPREFELDTVQLRYNSPTAGYL